MSWIDHLVILAYLGAVLHLGFRCRHQTTTAEYYLAGRSMTGLIAGISVTVTMFSAVTLMGVAAFAFEKDLSLVVGTLALPFTIPILTRVFLPFYHDLPITTGYQYLERRFGGAVHRAAGALYVASRLGYLAVVIYAPAVALAVVNGWNLRWNVLLMGLISVVLACLGGMRGVVRAEVLKFGVLAVSLGAVVSVLCLRIEGGMLHAWRVAAEGGRLRALDGSLDPTVTFASAWVAIGYFFQNLSSYGADQMAVQRYLTSRSIRESRRAVVFCSWSLIPINLMIAAIGALAYVFYRQHPELGAGLESGDYVLPHFAVHQLPRGLSGLVIANILSLSLTTHSAGLHSVNTVVMNDLVERFVRRDLAPRHHVRLARLGTVFWGAVTIVLALHVPALGSIVVASQKVSQFFGGVLLGIFLLGMLSRRTGSAAAALGALAGMGCVALAGRFTNVSYFWYAPLGCLATMASGYVTGLILPAPAAERTDGLCLAWRRKGRGPSSGTRF